MSLPSLHTHLAVGVTATPVAGMLSAMVGDWFRDFARWGLSLSAAECTEHLDTVSNAHRKGAVAITTRMS